MTLKLVSPPAREPWQQRVNEPNDCFSAFCEWLWTVPRQLPPAELADVVANYGWAQRAQAWDAFASNTASDKDMLAQIERDLLCWAASGAKALARSSVPAVPRDVLAAAAYLTGNRESLERILNEGAADSVDLSALSVAELIALRDIRAKLG